MGSVCIVEPCVFNSTGGGGGGGGGGVANLTEPPWRWGTCSDNRPGRPVCSCGAGGLGAGIAMLGGKKWGVVVLAAIGVDIGV